MPDNDNNDGMIEVPQNTSEASQVRIPSGEVELLEWQDLKTYDINIDQHYYGNDKIQIFKVPLTPHLNFTNIPLSSFYSQDTDHARQFRESIRNLDHAVLGNGSGQSISEFNNRNRFPTITLLDIRFKSNLTAEASYIPEKLKDAVALVLEVGTADIAKDTAENIAKYEKHRDRNKYQYGFAPSTIDIMQIMADCSFFYLYTGIGSDSKGYTNTHNLREEDDIDRKTRVRASILGSKDPETGARIRENVDYRAVSKLNNKPSKFKGMQFVYNADSGELVIDKLNKGTFDFKPPIEDPLGHITDDIEPWYDYGNVIPDDERIYMSKETEADINRIWNLSDISLEDKKILIYSLFPGEDLLI
jgi:hypothetical protein